MSPVTHFLIGWVVANAGGLDRRDRAVVTVAGVTPDVDGLGFIAEYLTRESVHPLWWYADYHRVIGHNLGFGLLTAAVGALLATRRWKAAALAATFFLAWKRGFSPLEMVSEPAHRLFVQTLRRRFPPPAG